MRILSIFILALLLLLPMAERSQAQEETVPNEVQQQELSSEPAPQENPITDASNQESEMTEKFFVYGALGQERVKDYSSGTSYGVGGGMSLNKYQQGLKAEVEYLRSTVHELSGTENGVGYTSKLEMQILAAYVGINLKIPDSWMESDSFLTKVEVTAKAGQALVMQKISSTPDDSSRATANDDVNKTKSASASGFGAGYYITEKWFAQFEQLFIGSDIQITRAGVRYDF